MQRTQDKSSYVRRRNEAYWGTPIDDNAVYGDLDKSNAQVICRQFLSQCQNEPESVAVYHGTLQYHYYAHATFASAKAEMEKPENTGYADI